MNEKIAIMLETILNMDEFQVLLKLASQDFNILIEQLDILSPYIPEGSELNQETLKLGLENYRAEIVTETRKTLTELAKNLKKQ